MGPPERHILTDIDGEEKGHTERFRGMDQVPLKVVQRNPSGLFSQPHMVYLGDEGRENQQSQGSIFISQYSNIK